MADRCEFAAMVWTVFMNPGSIGENDYERLQHHVDQEPPCEHCEAEASMVEAILKRVGYNLQS